MNKKLFLALAILLGGAVKVIAAPTFRSTGTAVEYGSVTIATFTYTLTAGDLLLVAIEGSAAVTPTIASVVWNGSESMTFIGSTSLSSFRNLFLYGLMGGTSGAHNAVVTFNAPALIAAGLVFGYSGVDTGTPWDTAGTNNGFSATPTVTAAGATGDTVVTAGLAAEDIVSLTMTNGTMRDLQLTSNVSFAVIDQASSASVTTDGTYGSVSGWTWVSVNLNAASGAGLAAGTITLSSKTATAMNLVCSSATGGTAPYTYQWYSSTTSGFAPGAGNILSGQTTLRLNQTGLTPLTSYYYKVVATDNVAAVSTSTQFGVRTDAAVTNTSLFFSPYNTYSDGSASLLSTNVRSDATHTIWNSPGAYLRFNVTVVSGSPGIVGIKVDPTTLATLTAANCPTLYYSIDGANYVSHLLSANSSSTTLASGLSAGTHEIEVMFKSVGLNGVGDRWSVPNNAVKIVSIEIDNNATLVAPTLRTNRAIFFGDSISEGAAVLGSDINNADNDASQVSPVLICRALNCEYGVMAFGGQGYQRGLGNVVASTSAPSMYNSSNTFRSWDYYHFGASRLFSGSFSPAPTYIFVEQGQNDAGALTVSTVTAALNDFRAAAGASTWIFAYPSPIGGNDSTIASGVAGVSDTTRTKKLSPDILYVPGNATKYSNDSFLGGGHPNVRGNAHYGAELSALAEDAMGGGGTTSFTFME